MTEEPAHGQRDDAAPGHPEARPIVVGVDGSDSSLSALDWAARQAELTGDALEVITTWEWPRSYGWAMPLPESWDPHMEATRVLATAVDRVRQGHPGITVRARAVEGHPAPVLIAASKDAVLLVVGGRGHGEFAGMLLGSVSEHCVARAHCPVVVAREQRTVHSDHPPSA